MKSIYLWIILLFITVLQSQNMILEEQWNQYFESNLVTYISEKAEDFVIDSKGNIIVTATGIISGNNTDLLVIKYDIYGNKLWEKSIHQAEMYDRAINIGVDSLDNIYLSGICRYRDHCRYIVVKLDPAGNIEWQNLFPRETSSGATSLDMSVDVRGNTYFVGSALFDGWIPYTTYLTAFKYSSQGELLWDYFYDNSDQNKYFNEWGDRVLIDQNNIFLIGKHLYSQGESSKVTIHKLSQSGIVDTVISVLAEGHWFIDGEIDSLGNIYILSTVYLGSYRSMLSKYNNDLSLLWIDTLDFQAPGNIYIAHDQACYLAAKTISQFDPNDRQCITIKYSKDGEKLWSKKFLGEIGLKLNSIDLTGDGRGNVFLLASDQHDILLINKYNFHVVKYDSIGNEMGEYVFDTSELENGRNIPSKIIYSPLDETLSFLATIDQSLTGYDVFVSKLDLQLNELWNNAYFSETTSYDNSISTEFDEQRNIYTLVKSNIGIIKSENNFYRILRYDKLGNQLEPIKISDEIVDNHNINDMIISRSGMIYLVGTIITDSTNSDLLVLTYDLTGNLIDQKMVDFDNKSNRGLFITEDVAENIIIAGVSDIDEEAQALIIAKFSSAGDKMWQKQIVNDASDIYNLKGLKIDTQDNIYLLSQKSEMYYVVKLSTAGNIIWDAEYAEDITTLLPQAFEIDSEQNIYITGHANEFSWRTVKYDSLGTFKWAKENDSEISYGSVTSGRKMLLDSFGNIYVFGQKSFEGSSRGYSELIKYNGTGAILWRKKIEGQCNLNFFGDENDKIYVFTLARNFEPETGVLKKYKSNGALEWEYILIVEDRSNWYSNINIQSSPDGNSIFMSLSKTWLDGSGGYIPNVESSVVVSYFYKQRYPDLPPEFATRVFQNTVADKYADVIVVPDSLLIECPQVEIISPADTIDVEMKKQDTNNIYMGNYKFSQPGSYKITTEATGINGLSQIKSRNFNVSLIQVGKHTTLFTPDSISKLSLTLEGTRLEMMIISDHYFIGDLDIYSFSPVISLGNPCRIEIENINEVEKPAIFQKSGDNWIQLKSSAQNDGKIIVAYSNTSGDFMISDAVFENESVIPEHYQLKQNYPNPFNNSTTIAYSLPENANVKIIIYDILGRKVKTLINSYQDAGYYHYNWNSTDDNNRPVASGIYIFRLQSDSFNDVKRMLLIK